MPEATTNRRTNFSSQLQTPYGICGTVVHIDIGALARNLQRIRAMLAPNIQFMLVVKKNAYGHGILPVALTAQDERVSSLAVFHVEDGLLLRESGIRLPILVLSPPTTGLLRAAIARQLQLTVTNAAGARDVMRASSRLGKRASIHLKLDTGLGRLGFEPRQVAETELTSILSYRNLQLSGVYSHLACGCDDLNYSRRQLTKLRKFANLFGRKKPQFHIASSGVLLADEFHLDMVRVGIAAYGARPNLPGFESVMRVTAPVIQVKTVGAGQSISYGRTYRTSRRTRIATVGAGYGDGYPVVLSNRGWVSFAGQKLPVIGRICMDQFMVDATLASTITAGSQVELIGHNVLVVELAVAANTISYELLCSLGSRPVATVETRGETKCQTCLIYPD